MGSTGAAAGKCVLLGKITRPHGIRGEVKIHSYSGQPENFLGYREILVSFEGQDEPIPYRVEQSRVQGKLAVLRLAGCDSRAEAEALAGREIWLRRSDFPEPAEDEYYLADLEDKEAVSTDGLNLGRITGIMDTAAHPILIVTGRGREYLVPVHKGVVAGFDEKQVVLRLPPGLVEMNDH
ncbi:MAG TPA: 16S rRNA processing protein RimM [Desulfobulbaceae bacterium]|nr:16S rRNA processing protein RimM [Desulfobulbaceae bacterium]